MSAAATLPAPARPFALQDVRLLPGPFHQAQQAHGVRLLAVQPDALLHPLRVRADLATRPAPRRGPLPPEPAWELGRYLSACAAMWAATSHPAFRQRLLHITSVLQQCQQALGGSLLLEDVGSSPQRGTLVSGLRDVLHHTGLPAAAVLLQSWPADDAPEAAVPDADDPARFGERVYRHDHETLYIDRFVASVLHWPAMGLRLRQLANCPEQGTARILLQAAERTRLVLRLRQPGWCARSVVSVNGRSFAEGRQPGAFIDLHRPWRRGDEIAVELPVRAPAPPRQNARALHIE